MPNDTPERPYHALTVVPDIEQKILDGIAAGKSLKSIADEHNVTDVAILRRAQKHPDYQVLRATGLQLRMDAREEKLESASDNVSVTRADRLLGHARWLAERLDPGQFGPKQEIKVDASITIVVQRFGSVADERHGAPLPPIEGELGDQVDTEA